MNLVEDAVSHLMIQSLLELLLRMPPKKFEKPKSQGSTVPCVQGVLSI